MKDKGTKNQKNKLLYMHECEADSNYLRGLERIFSRLGLDATGKGRTFALPIRNAERAAANPRATSASLFPVLRPICSAAFCWKAAPEKKVATVVAKVNSKELPLHPLRTRGAKAESKPKNFFRFSSWKKQETLLTFAARFYSKKRAQRLGNDEKYKNFFLSGSWKKQKEWYLCTPLQRKRGNARRTKTHRSSLRKKSFRKFLQNAKRELPLQPASIGRELKPKYLAAYERHTVEPTGALHTFFE
ncbi:hypothetical protein [Hymenobacter sp. UYP22]|uniref:hypothetical protein n=1 Tax=Hymenobacter sp. UYP22 TaxID=3156348 RepID=UPI00339747FF